MFLVPERAPAGQPPMSARRWAPRGDPKKTKSPCPSRASQCSRWLDRLKESVPVVTPLRAVMEPEKPPPCPLGH